MMLLPNGELTPTEFARTSTLLDQVCPHSNRVTYRDYSLFFYPLCYKITGGKKTSKNWGWTQNRKFIVEGELGGGKLAMGRNRCHSVSFKLVGIIIVSRSPPLSVMSYLMNFYVSDQMIRVPLVDKGGPLFVTDHICTWHNMGFFFRPNVVIHISQSLIFYLPMQSNLLL